MQFPGASCRPPSCWSGNSGMVSPRCFSFAAVVLIASTVSARAVDEIQVYNAEIAKVGQWTFQLHSNYGGFYTPFAVDQNLTPYSNAAKIRQLFVIPNASEREFFYGVNFEFSYEMPQFSDTQWNMEIRPIVGWRKNDYEFILNPIVDIGFGQNGGAVFAPAARFARHLGENLAGGVEYYPDLAPLL